MNYEQISVEVLGHVVRVCHNRPDKGNAESEQLLAEMDDALARLAKDDDCRVLILGGKGKHFSAGHDVVEAVEKRGDYTPDQIWQWEKEYYLGNAMRIWDFPKPTIAQVQGACIAGAFMVANSCDLMVASDNAYFQDPVLHSLGAASVETLVHPWVLGLRKAKEFLFTGERISAEEGRSWGMVNHVVPLAELEAFTLKLAERIAQAPPVATKMLKRSLNRTADIMGYRNSIQAHFDTHVVSQSSREMADIMAAGMQKSMSAAKKLT